MYRGIDGLKKKIRPSHQLRNPYTCCLEHLESRQLLSTFAPEMAAAEPIPTEENSLEEQGDLWVTLDPSIRRLSYTDPDGSQVSVTHKGVTAQVHLEGDGLSIEEGAKGVTVGGAVKIDEILLGDTNLKNKLSFSVKGGTDGLAEVGTIRGTGSLGKLQGKLVNLTGEGILLEAGYIKSAVLHDITNGAAIRFQEEGVSLGTSLQVHQIGSDSDLELGAGIKSLKVASWIDGNLKSPWAKQIMIHGDSQVQDPGDLGALMQIGREEVTSQEVVLGKLKVSGTASNAIQILGSAGTLDFQHFTGELQLTGDAKSIKLQDELALAPMPGGSSTPSGILNIAGSASIKGSRETMKVNEGCQLYTTNQPMYALEDMILFDDVGTFWEYDLKAKGAARFLRSGSAISMVTAYPGWSTNTYRMVEVAEIEYSYPGEDDWDDYWYDTQEQTLIWRKGIDGVYLVGAEAEMDIAYLKLDFASLKVAPPFMEVNQSYTDTAEVMGEMDISAGWSSITIDLEGVVQIETTLLGHETVTIPAGTFLAAKWQMDLSYDLSGTLETYEDTFKVNLGQSNNLTYWAVPDLGVVQSVEKASAHMQIPGVGKENGSNTVYRYLTGPENLLPQNNQGGPVLLSPAQGAVLDNGRTDARDDIAWDFDWLEVSGATEYHLYVMGKNAIYPVIDRQGITSSFYHDVSTGSYIIESNRYDWSWQVQARVNGQWRPWSQTRFFDVEPFNTDPPR